jgi:glycine betaine/proline transport system ATP-binding protein
MSGATRGATAGAADGATAAVRLSGVDIVFGTPRQRRAALAALDAGGDRAAILAATGAVIGAAGVDLDVAPGEVCVLMGLSGSGKSTVLRAVNGLAEVARGRVEIAHGGESVEVGRATPAMLRQIRRRRVAMVFQQFGLLPWRSVAENVGFGLELAGVGRARRTEIVREKLALVGLADWAERPANALSGGMQQRVGLARALATDADILLMDEPFSALDPLIRAKLQDDLLDLQKRLRKTILFVSHDLDEALKLGDRIAVMGDGRIAQYGTPEAIVLAPASDYVRDFVAHANPLAVFTAYNVMRDYRDLEDAGDGWVWLDRARRLRYRVAADGQVTACVRDGVAVDWLAAEEVDGAAGPPAPVRAAVWVRVGAPLRPVMLAMQHDPGPVGVFDDADRLVGAIDVGDLLKAVLARV